MRSLSSVLFIVALLCMPAAGQTSPDPVMEHYLAYRAALDLGDIALAEAEAEQALAASESRSGDGGPTAVLSLNLATTRLQAGDAAAAMAPAQRSLALAQAGATGVDATLAALIVGRAELGSQGRAGADRLQALLGDPATDALAAYEIYPAAAELGAWALAHREFEIARTAWATAAGHAEGSPLGAAFGYGRARAGEGVSIFLNELGRRRGRSRMNRQRAHEAYDLLTEAYLALQPLATVEAPGLELTLAERSYAEVMAWRIALRAKLVADNQSVPEDPPEAQGDADGLSELGPVNLAVPRCLLRLNSHPRPQFPSEQLRHYQLAGVVLRLRINAAGEIVENATVARIGDEAFSRAVEQVAPRWTVTRHEDSAPNCRLESTLLVPVSFIIG